MADDYTPTTTEVREYYMKSAEADDRRDEFNRWLAARDAQKRAEWEAGDKPSDAELRETIRQALRQAGEGEVYSDITAGRILRALRPTPEG